MWSDTNATGFLFDHWAWGLLGATVTAGINVALIRRLGRRGQRPASHGVRLHGLARAEQILCEDVIYGASEGVLLSVLPVPALRQAFDQLGWTAGWAQKLGAGALAYGGSLVVIGYTISGTGSFAASE